MNIYYPIGTMVKLTIDKDMLFMISGYLTKQGNGKTHDYFAVPFPLGLIKENQYISFNHSCITEVIQSGYCDNECQSFLNDLDHLVTNIKKAADQQKNDN